MSEQITPNPSVPTQIVADGLKFPKFINNLGIIPTSYKDSMSYYECLAWLCKYLEETVIPTVNQNGEAVEELQNLYIELNSYVTNYFDNLDVQEEINNKLDDMVEAGTLQEIIASYLNSKAVFGFDSVDDMKNSTNLIEGSYARTLGFYSVNDGGSALYKIREITNDDVVDNMFIIALNDEQNELIAELIINGNVNIKSIGAKGNGTDDDSSYIQACIDKELPIFIDKGSYLIDTTIHVNQDNSYINCLGTLTSGDVESVVSVESSYCEISIDKIINEGSKGSKIGLKIGKNTSFLGYNKININYIENFDKAILIDPNNSGVQYCKINFLFLSNNNYNIMFKASNTGWINQNTFNGGHVSGTYGIYTDATDSSIDSYNGNHFENFGFEQLTNECIHLEKSTMNTFDNFRLLENANHNPIIYCNENSSSNKFNSAETLFLFTLDKINDTHYSQYKFPNIYNINSNLNWETFVSKFRIINGLFYLDEASVIKQTAYYIEGTQTATLTVPNISKINRFSTDLSGGVIVTLNLDDRYASPDPYFQNLTLYVGTKSQNANLIIQINGVDAFNLNDFTSQTGAINKYIRLVRYNNKYIATEMT